jgi:hypothetical protein
MNSCIKLFLLLSITLWSETLLAQSTYDWAYQGTSGPGSCPGETMAMDNSGYVYIGGGQSADAILNLGSFTLDPAGQSHYYLAKYDSLGNVLWAIHEPGVGAIDLWDCKIGKDNMLYVAGRFFNSVTINGNTHNTLGGYDVFVACYDLQGNAQWSRSFGSTSFSDYAYGIDANSLGEVYVCGIYQGVLTIDNETINPPPGISAAGFLVKLNNQGQAVWLKRQYSSDGSRTTKVRCISDTAIAAIGYYQGTLELGTPVHSTATNGSAGYIVRYDSAGVVSSSANLTSSNALFSSCMLHSLDVAKDGKVYVCGSFINEVCAGNNCVTAIEQGALVVKYDLLCNPEWINSTDGYTHTNRAKDIIVDDNNATYITGEVSSVHHFSNSVTTFTLTDVNSYVAKYDSMGNLAHVFSMNANCRNYSNGIRINSMNEIFFTGYFQDGSMQFDSGTLYNGTGDYTLFIAKLNVPANPNNFVNGHIFNDLDGNAIQNMGEPYLAYQQINSTPSTWSSFSDSAGDYTIWLDTGAYNIFPILPLYWEATSPVSGQHPISFSSNNNGLFGYDFGMRAIPNIIDLVADITATNPARPGMTTAYQITVKNIGTANLYNSPVALAYDTSLTYLSSTISPNFNTNDSISWVLDSMLVGETKDIDVFFMLDTNVSLSGTYLVSNIQALPLVGDTVPINNLDTAFHLVTAAYDPNYKEIYPKGVGPEGYISSNQELEYTIHFQNTGTDTAFFINLIDTLSPLLDISTAQLIASSHPCQMNVLDYSALHFRFDSILLPDSTTNEVMSHGFAKFKINVHYWVSTGEIINNHALIYFDFNPPIYTDTTVNTIANCSIQHFLTDTTHCLGDSILFNVFGGALNVTKWFIDGQLTSTTNNFNWLPNSTGVYLLSVSTSNTYCSTSDSMLLNVIDCSVGYEDVQFERSLKVYPNPSTSVFTIEIPNGKDKHNCSYEVFNSAGQLIMKENDVSNSFQVNLNSFSTGLYFLRVYDSKRVYHSILNLTTLK